MNKSLSERFLEKAGLNKDGYLVYDEKELRPLFFAAAECVKALEPLLEWAIENHEMPHYSEVIFSSKEALERLEKVVGK